MGLGMIRCFYHSKFEQLIRYGIIFWGADNASIPIFKLQQRVMGSECGAGRGTSCGQLFKDCKILTVTSLYVLKCQVFLKKYKSAVQKLNSYMIIIKGQIWIYIPNLVIKISIKNVINMGIRQYNKVAINIKKLEEYKPNGQLLTKIENSGVDSRVVIWIKEFLLGRMQRVRVGGHLSEEVRVTSGVPQGSVLSPLLFLAYVNDIWRNIESTIRLFADDCVIYKKKL